MGYYCPYGSGAPRPCPPGLYSAGEGRFTCSVCPPGYYCAPDNASAPIAPQECPLAHYCPNGTRLPGQFPCPTGTIGNQTRLTAPADCPSCPAGMYCSRAMVWLAATVQVLFVGRSVVFLF